MEVDPLHEPLGLHAHERGSRAVDGELLLPDATQIAGADVVANPRQLERPLILGRRSGEHLLAPAGRGLGGERVLDLGERAGADPAVIRDRLALLGRADPDLRLERAACEQWREQAATCAPDRIVAILEHEQLAREVVDRSGQLDRRQTCGLRFLGPKERGSDAPVGCDDVGPAFEQLGGQSRRDRARPLRELRRDVDRGRRIAADQRLERAQRLLPRKRQLQDGVPERLGVGASERRIVAVAPADLLALFREHHELLARRHHVLGEALLQSRLHREEIGFRHQRRYRLPGVLGVGNGRLVTRRVGGTRGAHAAPEIQLPVGENATSLQS